MPGGGVMAGGHSIWNKRRQLSSEESTSEDATETSDSVQASAAISGLDQMTVNRATGDIDRAASEG